MRSKAEARSFTRRSRGIRREAAQLTRGLSPASRSTRGISAWPRGGRHDLRPNTLQAPSETRRPRCDTQSAPCCTPGPSAVMHATRLATHGPSRKTFLPLGPTLCTSYRRSGLRAATRRRTSCTFSAAPDTQHAASTTSRDSGTPRVLSLRTPRLRCIACFPPSFTSRSRTVTSIAEGYTSDDSLKLPCPRRLTHHSSRASTSPEAPTLHPHP